MSFFENSKVETLAQNQVEEVQDLNKREVKKMMKLYKSIRLELIDRLHSMPKGTFTSQRMRSTLVQIDAALVEMQRILGKGIKESSMILGERSSEDLIKEINTFDKEFTGAVFPLDLDAALVASKTSNFLFERHESSLEAYSKALRQDFAMELTEAVLTGKSNSEIVMELGQKFKGEQWKLERIARTELHNVYNIAKMDGMKEVRDSGDIPDLMKTLFHPMDNRTGADSKALNHKNPKIPIDDPFKFKWGDQERVFMAPPDRPNDRAILLPYRKDWK